MAAEAWPRSNLMFLSIHDDAEQAVSALAESFAARAAEHDEHASFPFENIAALHKVGLLALVAPKEFGGLGAGLVEAEKIINRIAQAEPSTALVLAQQYLFLKHILPRPRCSDALKEKIFRSAASDGGLGNLLRVEPDLGTPFRGGLPATIARRVDGGWRISGRKIYSTGAPALTWLAVWARTDDEVPLVGNFIAPRDAEGVRVEETWNHLGMRASGSHDVVLANVFVPEDHAADLRQPGEWLVPDPDGVAWFSTLFASVYDGVARAARNWLIHFLQTRAPSNLGAPLATLPRMQEAVGLIEALLYGNRVHLETIAARADGKTPPTIGEASFMKFAVNRNAIAAVEKAIEVTGNPGLSRDNPLQRHYRDVLCARVHSPQNDSILVTAGRRALGLDT
jgi:alkylation response protein AidB-like acyl-CoA dehydrogenase